MKDTRNELLDRNYRATQLDPDPIDAYQKAIKVYNDAVDTTLAAPKGQHRAEG